MEATKMMKLFAVMVVMMMSVSVVSAQDAPAPSPVSDATMVYVPTMIAALFAIACAFVF
ncbi:transmembrane protein [Artemisia annua]|uniref:Transmembrane protein n=1 Tax=Artemisia annua TaxID=35608 RepID=A0A2U1QBB5_ARTAN|nr:transmembrane protein [Artemisia annua]